MQIYIFLLNNKTQSNQNKELMAKKQKYYTVWDGKTPGVYSSWKECEDQIKGYENAKYKSFDSLPEANNAFVSPWYNYIGKNAQSKIDNPDYKNLPHSEQPVLDSIAVDAACSGNPGMMEYRGVDVRTGYQIFHLGPLEQGTNNIGEFLAIVHAIALFYKNNPSITIYSDSKTALSWIKNKKAKTKNELGMPCLITSGLVVIICVNLCNQWLKSVLICD